MSGNIEGKELVHNVLRHAVSHNRVINKAQKDKLLRDKPTRRRHRTYSFTDSEAEDEHSRRQDDKHRNDKHRNDKHQNDGYRNDRVGEKGRDRIHRALSLSQPEPSRRRHEEMLSDGERLPKMYSDRKERRITEDRAEGSRYDERTRYGEKSGYRSVSLRQRDKDLIRRSLRSSRDQGERGSKLHSPEGRDWESARLQNQREKLQAKIQACKTGDSTDHWSSDYFLRQVSERHDAIQRDTPSDGRSLASDVE